MGSVDAQRKAKQPSSRWRLLVCQRLRVKNASETNENALKVSLILEVLHLTLYAALIQGDTDFADQHSL